MILLAPHRIRARPAAAAAEMALVLPVLVTLVLGCIDFGRFSHVNITVTNAARTGAEFGSSHPYTAATTDVWEQQVRQAVVDEMSKLDRYEPELLIVTVTPVVAGDNRRVEVDVSYPFEMLIDWPGLPKHLTLRRVVSMPMSRQ